MKWNGRGARGSRDVSMGEGSRREIVVKFAGDLRGSLVGMAYKRVSRGVMEIRQSG